MIKNILTIAGTDPSGGAGIQADIKTFSALGTYAMSVITAVVAQNTQGVMSYQTMSAELVGQQIDAIFQDISVDAVKIGMLANAEIVQVVAEKLKQYSVKNIVLDPVMVAKSGDALIDEAAITAIWDILLPLVTIITPNIPEACVLLDIKPTIALQDMEQEARRLLQFKSQWALLKGGHLAGNICCDVLCSSSETYEFSDKRIITKNDHGTGCTLSSAITALLPTLSVPKAVEQAKIFLGRALQASDQLNVGKGHGPLHHFYDLWNK